MRRKACNRLLLIGLTLTTSLFISGYGEMDAKKVQPNQFKKQKTTIDTNEINTDVKGSYHKIPSQVRALTFASSHQDEQVKKELFQAASKPEKINVKNEAEQLQLFQ
ncbi:type VII secretion EssA family protein [Sporolactobacillus terrae]|uniref:type VII secretion EssA family protein n=1 Tax=Sporolactobacillus terrae TaxID=269673 RepID=UPI00048CBA01|nr:type VII secretion EssA family protein [Sporolactobacillus terrae]